MSDACPATATQPVTRTCPFDPPPEYRAFREEAPVARVTFPDGAAGWLVTRYADIRTVLSDPRFSSRRRMLRASIPLEEGAVPPPAPGWFILMDAPEHTRFRRLLTGRFTVRRMRELAPAVERIVAERLDAMAAAGGPADLVQDFALPIPSLVICELLGVPYEDDEYVAEAIRAGASGFLGKGINPGELLDAIRLVAAGDALLSPAATKALIARFLSQPAVPDPEKVPLLAALTPREREVVTLVATGLSNDEIAARLHVTPLTAKTHVNRAMVKLGARDRAQLVVIAYRTGLARVGAE